MQQTDNASPKFTAFYLFTYFGGGRYQSAFKLRTAGTAAVAFR